MNFSFNLLTHSPERLNVISTRLGTGGNDQWDDKELGKAVKLGTSSNHIQCADGDEIEAIVDSIDSGGTSGGFTFGGVARGNRGFRAKAQIGAGQADPVNVGDLVVADAQLAVGTKGVAQVKVGEPVLNKWRILAISGTGVAGDQVVIELC